MSTNSDSQASFWALIPCAGVGSRMRASLPKQYLPLHGKTVIEHTLAVFERHPRIAGIVVVLSENDRHFASLNITCTKPLLHVQGGEERCHSVLNGLQELASHAEPGDWVLVHDAARPCLRREDIDKLMDELKHHATGGLLGMPVRDTIKRADSEHRIYETVPRAQLWHALTPQMFRLGELTRALIMALDKGTFVTDDASAMELAGKQPVMIEGRADNIKITRPDDLALAAFFLSEREKFHAADELGDVRDLDGMNADEG